MAEKKQKPGLRVIAYGDPGGGKTEFAASFPKPLLAFAFDAPGKEQPFRRCGDEVIETIDEEWDMPVTIVKKAGKEVVRIEHFRDAESQSPEAWAKFRKRMHAIDGDELAGEYRTVVFDSITSAELCARCEQQFKVNPKSKEPRQWYAGSKEQIEFVVMTRLPNLPSSMNVLVLAHVDEDRDEVHNMMVYNPSAPGKLRKHIARNYTEMYRVVAKRNPKEGGIDHYLQTEPDGEYLAFSTICNAPDRCENTYRALWTEWEG